MTLNMIKDQIISKLCKEVKVICNCVRNKNELYYGKITEIYGSVFIVKLYNNENKCFCYSDVLTNNVMLIFK